LQSFVDGLKLVLKEGILPHQSNKLIFIGSAIAVFISGLSS
jgi:NADH:ubiquinone oxidoreductase subunit H